MVRGRAGSYIAHRLIDIGRVKNDRAWPDANPLVTNIRFDRSLLHDDDLIVWAFENDMIGGAGIERRSMALQHIEIRSRSFEKFPAGTVRVCFNFDRIPFDGV